MDRTISDIYTFDYILNNNNEILTKRDKLIEFIDLSLRKINNNLYIISYKYDIYYNKYNNISLTILIFSTLVTFIQSFQLFILYYIDNINKNHFVFITNITSLLISTLLTILSSIIKFRNYSIIMSKLKDIQHILFDYKLSYNKQKQLLLFFEINGILDNKNFDKLYNKIIEYNNEIIDINIFENISINDIIKIKKKNKKKSLNKWKM
jgi:hypothetical protein